MLEESVFTDDTIVETVKEQYGIEVKSIKKINRGSANIYSLNDDSYILKEFQSTCSKEEIYKEIEVINHLRKYDLLVPEYICTVDNEYSFTYKDRLVILQKYIDGYVKESNTGDYSQVIECARELGKMVKALETLEYELPLLDVTSWFKK